MNSQIQFIEFGYFYDLILTFALMKTDLKPLLGVFFLIAVLEIWAEFSQNTMLRYATKPLLLTLLSVYFFLQTKTHRPPFSTFIFFGLVFSIGGDTLLMFQGDNFFIGGLVCFLMTHVFYALAFYNFKPDAKGFIKDNPLWLIPFALFWVGFNVYLWSDLGDLKIPVLVYSAVITLMAIAALNIRTKLPAAIFDILFIGILLFMFSDSMIALNKFKSAQLSIPYPSLWIMISYIAAQYLIMQQCLKMNGVKKSNKSYRYRLD